MAPKWEINLCTRIEVLPVGQQKVEVWCLDPMGEVVSPCDTDGDAEEICTAFEIAWNVHYVMHLQYGLLQAHR